MVQILKFFAIGIVLGIANVIPGVSGGTMAVVFNIYDNLIGVITFNIKKILSEWRFWAPLLAGIIAGVILFSKLITFLFLNYPAPAKCFFIGIILGSIPLIYNRAKKPGSAFMPVSGSICAIIALLVILCMVLVRPDGNALDFSQISFPGIVFLFAAGMIAAVAMIIPGISGSFMLLAMGVYSVIIGAVSGLTQPVSVFIKGNQNVISTLSTLQRPLLILIPFGIGVVAGLLAGASLVRVLIEKAPLQTYGAILGLITGSILVIYPRGGFSGIPVVITSLVCLLFGAGLSLLFSRAEGTTKIRKQV
jgi:putative membrane protein